MNQIPRPIFDRTITYGHLLQSALLLIAILGGMIYLVRWQEEVNTRLNFAEQMRPIVEMLARSDVIQAEKIANFSDDLGEVRRSQSTIIDKVGDISTAIAVIKERVERTAN